MPEARSAQSGSEVEIIRVARCETHGLHGCRETCFVCEEPVEQVEYVRWADVREAVEHYARYIPAVERTVSRPSELHQAALKERDGGLQTEAGEDYSATARGL